MVFLRQENLNITTQISLITFRMQNHRHFSIKSVTFSQPFSFTMNVKSAGR